MACSLALTIQVLDVEEATLVGLLSPELTLAAIKAVAEDMKLTIVREGATIGNIYAQTAGYDGITISVRGSRISVQGGYQRAKNDEIAAAVRATMKQIGIAILGTNVQDALREMTGVEPEVVEAPFEQEGRIFPAMQLTVSW